MRFLILEDEPLIAKRLNRMVLKVAGEMVFDTTIFHQLDDAIKFVQNEKVDLCFLDLNLNGENGFELLKIGNRKFQTIITSSHGEKALEAYNYEVLDFVPKPFREERLKVALDRFKNQLPVFKNSLLVEHHGQQKVLPLNEIAYIKGAGNYTQVSCSDGQQYLHSESLGALESRLKSCFLRIHKSYLVAPDKIKSIKNHGGGKYEACLENCVLPISRAQYSELQRTLNAG